MRPQAAVWIPMLIICAEVTLLRSNEVIMVQE